MRSQPIDQACDGGLAAAGGTAEHHELAAFDREVEVVYTLALAMLSAVMEAHVLEFDHKPAAPFVVTSTTIVALRTANSSIVI